MGFNKCFLPDIDKLRDMVFDYGLEMVVKRYKPYDAYIGSEESLTYLEQLIAQYESVE